DYGKVLSAGVIDGRNIWRANLNNVLATLEPLKAKLGDRLWISSSCSLLHTPYDLSVEEKLKVNKPALFSWLAFTLQKTQELRVLKTALNQGREAVAAELADSQAAADSRANSTEIHRAEVAKRLADLP
ncbi:5-methyltetrahydropteroyltriglutamate--homocysteine S-methyltransferase, partial [Enterobacter hormaechei subsp. steigerwaltii]|nr:5-methyltetrahydropteroyltriglutamate--homocysteine S-methyltransferase [Enterobacter hormaechei subsp. steigerwaltii]